MDKIGRKIYFEITTGNIIVDTGERQGSVKPTTPEQDILSYKALSERVIGSFAYIELPFGQYAQDFAESNGYRVNVDMISELQFEEGYKALEFSYPDPNAPEDPQPFVKPITQQIEDIKLEMARSNTELFETMLMMNGGA